MLFIVCALLLWATAAEIRAYKNMRIANANNTSAEAWLATTLLHVKAEKAAKTYLEIIGDLSDTQQNQVFYLQRQLAKNSGYVSSDMHMANIYNYLMQNYADRLRVTQAGLLEAKKLSKKY